MAQILIYNTQRDLPLSKTQVKKVVSFLLQELNIVTHEVSLHFVSEASICSLHKRFFNDPSPTDCITFPMDAPTSTETLHHILGEAFICPKVAKLYAQAHHLSPKEELYRYVLHCLLHLIGYTDTHPRDRARMKRKETRCFKKLLFALKQNLPPFKLRKAKDPS